jgi:hypothetical protein
MLGFTGSSAVRAGEAAAPTLDELPAGLSALRVRQRAASRPATPDLVTVMWRCAKCKGLNPARRLLPEQPPFDKLSDVRELLLRVGLGQGGGWPVPTAEFCGLCRADAPSKPDFAEVLLFRYLAETGCDAVARMPVTSGKAGDVVWGRLDVSGAYDPLGRLIAEEYFREAFGRVLSAREAWADVAGESIAKRSPVVMKAAPGYFLTCRRAGADGREDDRLAAELGMALDKLEGRTTFRGRSIRLGTAEDAELAKLIPTCREWLPGQWRQLAEGKYVAEAVVDASALRRLAERELAAGGRDLRIGEYSASMDLDEVTARTVRAGLTLGEGLQQFVWPEARRLYGVSRIGERARALLYGQEVSVEAGTVLLIRRKPAPGSAPGSGAEIGRLNLAVLAGEIDPSAPGAVEGVLSGLLGLDTVTGEIRPPKASDTRCGCGQEAWLARKPRPRGYFKKLGANVAYVEWRGVELAWSLDCPTHSRYLPAADLPAEKGLEERYARDVEKATFQIVAAKGLVVEKSQARLALGPDISATMADPRLRRGLARRLKGDLPGKDMLFWAPTTNMVIVSPQPITGQVRVEMRRAALEMAREAGLAPGEDLDLEIRDKLTAEPAGTFSAPPSSPRVPAERR